MYYLQPRRGMVISLVHLCIKRSDETVVDTDRFMHYNLGTQDGNKITSEESI
jgi:hypothetical protein